MKKELLRVGTWNKTVKISLNRLKELAQNFNNTSGKTKTGYRVPLFLGHPDDPSKEPAKGWLSKVWTEGKSLFGEFIDMTDETKEEIKKKIFRDVSVGILGSTFRHVALTNDPAVSDLGDFFNNNDSETQTITLSQIKEENYMDTKLQDAMNEIATLKADKAKLGEDFEAQKAENAELSNELKEVKTALEDSNKKLSEKEKEFNELSKEVEENEIKLADEKDAAFVDGLIKDRKLRPVDKDITLINLKAHRGKTEELSFKDGEGKEVKKTALEAYKDSLESADEILSSGEIFKDGVERKDHKESRLEKLTNEYAEKHNVSYNIASTKILQEHPELNTEVI